MKRNGTSFRRARGRGARRGHGGSNAAPARRSVRTHSAPATRPARTAGDSVSARPPRWREKAGRAVSRPAPFSASAKAGDAGSVSVAVHSTRKPARTTAPAWPGSRRAASLKCATSSVITSARGRSRIAAATLRGGCGSASNAVTRWRMAPVPATAPSFSNASSWRTTKRNGASSAPAVAAPATALWRRSCSSSGGTTRSLVFPEWPGGGATKRRAVQPRRTALVFTRCCPAYAISSIGRTVRFHMLFTICAMPM